MMVPASRLLWWTAAAVVPLATASTLLPGAEAIAGCLLGLFGCVVIADGWRGWGQRHGIGLETIPVCRLRTGRPGCLGLGLRSNRLRPANLRLALAWPEGLHPDRQTLEVHVPGGESALHLEWTCTAARRGRFALVRGMIESGSPWGFWRVRRGVPLRCEIRAYPDLLAERRQVAAVFLNRGLFGVHAQRVVGRGREFEKLRDYVAGDSTEDIHWKTTAKRGRPVTKTYQMERTQEVYVLLDVSRLSGRPAPGRAGSAAAAGEEPDAAGGAEGAEGTGATVLERFLVASLVLGVAAGRQGDLFGLLTFSDRVHAFLRARNGRGHFEAVREALLTVQPRPVAPDFDEAFTFVRLRLRRRALLVVLTALDDPLLGESFARSVELVHRQHLVLVNLLRPGGVRVLFDQAEVGTVAELYDALAGHLRWQQLRELQVRLQHHGVRLGLLDNERLAADLLRQYLDVKHRQQL